MEKKMFNSMLVATGGAVGSLLRYFVSLVHPFGPLSTIIVNVVGSFFLGFITSFFIKRKKKEWLKLLFGTGFCGGFTTMSTFSLEVTLLPVEQAILYMCFSILFSIIFAMLGMKVANIFPRLEL